MCGGSGDICVLARNTATLCCRKRIAGTQMLPWYSVRPAGGTVRKAVYGL